MYADDYDIGAEVVQSTSFWFETLFTDSKNRLLYVCQPQKDGYFDEINGPALTSYKYGSSDTVMAVRCKSWPESEDEWPRRRSLYTQKKKFSQYLCFLIKSTILHISLSIFLHELYYRNLTFTCLLRDK